VTGFLLGLAVVFVVVTGLSAAVTAALYTPPEPYGAVFYPDRRVVLTYCPAHWSLP
jgi:hypothetical protein